MGRRTIFTLFIGCLILHIHAQDPIFHLDFDEENLTSTTTENISGNTLQIKNNFNGPERIDANFGKALRVDGFSTYISDLNLFLDNYDSELTVEAWFAPEAFSYESAALIQSRQSSGGFRMLVGAYGGITFTFFSNGEEISLTTNQKLSRNHWYHIACTANADSGIAKIYVNGNIWAQQNFNANSSLTSTQTSLWVGKSSTYQVVDGFPVNILNGAIDDVKVYNVALSESQIQSNYDTANSLDADLIVDPDIRHAGDYLRPRYHAMPNTYWANESYGLTYFEGKYHMFFQKNPHGPYWNYLHWGHLSSPDLVTWKEESIALAPSLGFDSYGVWSGTTFKNDQGDPVIFYTGVDGIKAGIGVAYKQDNDLIAWEKGNNNPIIANPPVGWPNLDFRDPFLFEHNGTYYMIIGSGLANNGGGVLFTYTSDDLQNWQIAPPIFNSPDLVNHGYFWEMPAFFEIAGGHYVLSITPLYNGEPANTKYWVGSFDGEEFSPYFEVARNLEHISQNLLAPAFGQDEHNRWAYIGIIPDDRNVDLQVEAGWRHTFSIPRLVRLLDNNKTLGVIPHSNLCRLRQDSVVLNDLIIAQGEEENFLEFESLQGEIEVGLDFQEAQVVEIQVFKSPTTGNKTKVILDRQNGIITLDRSQSSFYPTVEDVRQYPYFFHPNGETKIRVFLDHSVIEVFVDDLISFSARVYPPENGTNIDIISNDNSFLVKHFKGYQLGDKSSEFEDTECPSPGLPGNLFTSVWDPGNVENIEVSPNPAVESIHIEILNARSGLEIFDSSGKFIYLPRSGKTVDISNLKPGVYFGKVNNGGELSQFKFIKSR